MSKACAKPFGPNVGQIISANTCCCTEILLQKKSVHTATAVLQSTRTNPGPVKSWLHKHYCHDTPHTLFLSGTFAALAIEELSQVLNASLHAMTRCTSFSHTWHALGTLKSQRVLQSPCHHAVHTNVSGANTSPPGRSAQYFMYLHDAAHRLL